MPTEALSVLNYDCPEYYHTYDRTGEFWKNYLLYIKYVCGLTNRSELKLLQYYIYNVKIPCRRTYSCGLSVPLDFDINKISEFRAAEIVLFWRQTYFVFAQYGSNLYHEYCLQVVQIELKLRNKVILYHITEILYYL